MSGFSASSQKTRVQRADFRGLDLEYAAKSRLGIDCGQPTSILPSRRRPVSLTLEVAPTPREPKVKLILSASCLFLAATAAIAQSQADAELAQRKAEERLTFQSGDPWTPRINLNADAAMVYGIGPKLPGLVTS